MADVAADGFPGAGRDRLVVEVGQVDQAHDGREVAAEQFQAGPRGQNAGRADVDAVFDPMAEEHGDQPRHAVARLGLGHKSRGDVTDRRGMAKVFAHELLDRQQAGYRRIAAHFGNAELFGPIEHVGGLLGVEVQFVAQAEQEFAGPLDGLEILLSQHAPCVQFVRIGRAIADETDPADQLHVAEGPPRALDVRLQQENRLAITKLFLEPIAEDAADEPAAAAAHLAAKLPHVVGEQRVLPRKSRDSTSDVQIVGSRHASTQACFTVRTLWPSVKPASNTSRNSRSAKGATRTAAVGS